MTLLDHNKQTLDEVISFTNQGLNCCVVNPCGSGKTAVMAKFIEQNPKSSFVIITKQKNAAKYYREKSNIFSDKRISIVTYTKMFNDFKAKQTDVYNTDYLLIDEAHYLGAEHWGKAFNYIYTKYHPQLIGFTATPQRFEDQGSDRTIVTQIFDGNSAGNFSTKQLEEKGLFVEPEYVLSIYNLQSIIDDKLNKIADSDLDDNKKDRLCEKLNQISEKWNNESRPDKILGKHLSNYMYRPFCNRILVYVANTLELPSKRTYIDNTIKSIFPDKTVTSYVYTHKTSEDDLRKFLKDDRRSDIKVLYSVDKIMETIHIDDLRIIIMLRPSVSNRIIIQQFGRINNINNKNKPIIIDMVDNLSNINSISGNTIFGENTSHGQSQNINVTFPHISYYKNVFDIIDKTLMSSYQHFTYKEFTGSLSDICKIYGKRYEHVKELLKKYDFDTAMSLADNHNRKMTQKIFDDESTIKDFQLTPEQKQYAEQNMGLVESFIERRNITNDDWKQEIYVSYLNAVYKTDNKLFLNYKRKQYITNSLKNTYITLVRNYVMRKDIFTSTYEHFENASFEYNLSYNIEDEQFKNAIHDVITTLTDREQFVINYMFGFIDGKEHTLEETGKKLLVTRERVRQIEAKALRRLRGPSRNKQLKEFKNHYQERNEYDENQALARLRFC